MPCHLLLEWERAGGAALLSQEDLESRRLVYETTRRCPRCGTKIERNGGCLHMTCRTEGGTKGCGCVGRVGGWCSDTKQEIDGLTGPILENKLKTNSFQFCWRCLRPWRRETHKDFFSCTLTPAQTLQGAWDEMMGGLS